MQRTRDLDVITTTLKREWFAKIVARSKRIEYREIKPHWTTRLKHLPGIFGDSTCSSSRARTGD
jgi:hypothetical protein